ncbi:hypothetical protein V6269_23645, partial [Enterobacter roggenkampii]
KRAYCLKTQPATGETYPKSDLFNKAREYPSSLEGPIFWLSYLAKERGKLQTGKGTRMYSTSKLSRKTLGS